MRHLISITLIIVFFSACLLAVPSWSGGIGTSDRPSYWGEILLTAVVVVAIVYVSKVFGERVSKYDYVEGWVDSKNTDKNDKLYESGTMTIITECVLYSEPSTEAKPIFTLPAGYNASIYGVNDKEHWIPLGFSSYSLNWEEKPKIGNLWYKIKIPVEKQGRSYSEKIEKAEEKYLEEKY
ncbi:MAG: hypothetical protein WC632_04645 [Candidatus Margulisiibacteriota bacterium]